MRFPGLALILMLGACTAAGTYDPNMADRVAADLTCVNQLALDGLGMYLGGASVKTAKDVATTVTQASSLTPQALASCAQTLQNVGYDLAAAKAKVKAASK